MGRDFHVKNDMMSKVEVLGRQYFFFEALFTMLFYIYF